MSKEAVMVVLDVGRSMQRDISGGTTALDLGKKAVRLLLQQKIMFCKQDEVGIVLVGTRESDNRLYHDANGDDYRSIKTAKELAKPTMDLMEYVATLDVEDAEGDVTDGILVALDRIFMRVTNGNDKTPRSKWLKFLKKIFVVTDAGGACALRGREHLIKTLNDNDVGVNFIGIGFVDEEAIKGEDDDNRAGADAAAAAAAAAPGGDAEAGGKKRRLAGAEASGAAAAGASAAAEDEVKVERKHAADDRPPAMVENERQLRALVDELQLGAVLPCKSALHVLGAFRSRAVLPVTKMRGFLELGPARDKIAVWTYGKTHMEVMPSLKKLSLNMRAAAAAPAAAAAAEDDAAAAVVAPPDVKMEKTFWNPRDGDNKEVMRDAMISALPYGGQLVPVSDESKELFKAKSERALSVLGFTKSNAVGRQDFMGTVDLVVPEPGNQSSALAVSALARAMAEADVIALVKYVKRANSAPLFGCLIPTVGADLEGFYFNQLPFTEDLRDFAFPSMRRAVPSDAQLGAARALIHCMDVGLAADDDGEPGEAYKPKATFNPALQRFYQAVQSRAFDPTAPVDEIAPEIRRLTEPIPALFAGAASALSAFAHVCPVEKSETAAEEARLKKLHWRDAAKLKLNADLGRVQQDVRSALDEDEDEEKGKEKDGGGGAAVAAASDAAVAGSGASGGGRTAVAMDLFDTVDVSQVGTKDPVRDLAALVQKARRTHDVALLGRAFTQMGEVVARFVKDSFGDSHFDKAVSCLVALRRACVAQEEPGSYNTALSALRSAFERRRPQFWQYLADSEGAGVALRPVSTDEVAISNMSAQEAAEYFRQAASASAPAAIASSAAEEAESMLDELE